MFNRQTFWDNGITLRIANSEKQSHTFSHNKNNTIFIECSPVSLTKAIKNEIEIHGFINCHIKDSAALCSYFAWLEKEVPKGSVSEVSGADKLGKDILSC